MKKQILAAIALLLVLGGVIAMNFFMPVPSADLVPYSDTVTAPDPNWPSPEEIAKGQEALQQLLDK